MKGKTFSSSFVRDCSCVNSGYTLHIFYFLMVSDSFSLQNCLDTLHRKQIKESEEMESKTKGLLNEVRLQFSI